MLSPAVALQPGYDLTYLTSYLVPTYVLDVVAWGRPGILLGMRCSLRQQMVHGTMSEGPA